MNTIQILIVDDNPHFMNQFSNFLADHPEFNIVGTAASGEEAILAVDTTVCNVIVMDVVMPGIGGFEATTKLRQKNCSSGIILTSTSNDPYYHAAALKAGADAFISKDDWGDKGVDTIRRIAQQRRQVSHRNIF
jgi:DNA-binding NarL/FixJ family response regulator